MLEMCMGGMSKLVGEGRQGKMQAWLVLWLV